MSRTRPKPLHHNSSSAFHDPAVLITSHSYTIYMTRFADSPVSSWTTRDGRLKLSRLFFCHISQRTCVLYKWPLIHENLPEDRLVEGGKATPGSVDAVLRDTSAINFTIFVPHGDVMRALDTGFSNCDRFSALKRVDETVGIGERRKWNFNRLHGER